MDDKEWIGAIAADWWQSNQDRPGALARLRRCAGVIDVIREPAALDLIRRLPDENPDRVAIVAGLLACVRTDDDRPVARCAQDAGWSQERFRRLMRTPLTDPELFLRRFRRLVHFLKGKANVADLASSLLRWGGKTHQRWIFDFHGVPSRDPVLTDKETSSHA